MIWIVIVSGGMFLWWTTHTHAHTALLCPPSRPPLPPSHSVISRSARFACRLIFVRTTIVPGSRKSPHTRRARHKVLKTISHNIDNVYYSFAFIYKYILSIQHDNDNALQVQHKQWWAENRSYSAFNMRATHIIYSITARAV